MVWRRDSVEDQKGGYTGTALRSAAHKVRFSGESPSHFHQEHRAASVVSCSLNPPPLAWRRVEAGCVRLLMWVLFGPGAPGGLLGGFSVDFDAGNDRRIGGGIEAHVARDRIGLGPHHLAAGPGRLVQLAIRLAAVIALGFIAVGPSLS